MTKFADQLLDDLMREHGPALAHTALAHTTLAHATLAHTTLAHATRAAHPGRHITTRGTLLAGGGALAVAGAVAGALVAVNGTPAQSAGSAAAAAYTVTKNPDGTITLAVYRQSGIAAANARLHTLGDRQVVVVPIEQGCTSTVTPPAVSGKGHQITTGIFRSPDGTITVNAHGIPAGDILVIGVATSGGTSYSVGTLASPPAPSCTRTPPLPPGSSGSGSTGGSGS
jgi:hypothetical protein